MQKYIITGAIFAAALANAGTAYFDGIKANSVIIQGNPAITNIVVSGTNYSGGSVTIPPGPKGDTGATGASGTITNWLGYSFTNLNEVINVTTQINQVTTNLYTTNLYNAVDASKWPTNTAFVAHLIWTNAGECVSTTNGGVITVTINTNSGTGGTLNHESLTNILGNGHIHLSAAEAGRIPTAYGTNSAATWTGYGTNYYWQPTAVNYQNNLTVTWTHQTNFTYQGVVTQTFTIPNGVPLLQVKAWGGGGGGGNGGGASGGSGGFAAGTHAVNAGDIIYIMVAAGGIKGASTNNSSAWPGGGAVNTNGGSYFGGGGGGYTLVAINNITNVVEIAAGGGGGAGANSTATGSSGGGSTGASGGVAGGITAATGGSQLAPGTGGSYSGFPTGVGGDGVGRVGGNVSVNGGYKGGAGGGGLYGGGAGGSASVNGYFGGGAGGSCYGQYVERSNNTADESYQGTWGTGGPASTDGSSGAVVLRYYYSTP